ncbi:unnamed protein product [Oikopleura dioica]|uniref:Uncharacterized protein n=2 Tax=Oikopleura dioica TaxID=34765 RepID=E4XUZ8_OIKDI|nr:unnamed protein product [Oikopleura dioica]
MKLLIGIIASALGLEARGFQTGIKENGERSCSCIGDPDWCADFCSGSGGNGGDNGSCSCVGDPQWCEDFCNGNGGGNGGGISDPEVIMKSTLSDCGWYNWSMVKCATEMHDRIQRNTGNQYSCIVTDDYSGYAAWKTYNVEDSWNKLAAVCAPKSNTAVSQYYFEQQCDECAYMCTYASDKPSCVRDCISDRGQRFCSNSSGRYNLVVTNWNPDVAYYAYGAHLYGARGLVYCTGYCVM